MSDNTLNKALRIMGYATGPGGDHCAHGFRSTASTLLNEEGAFDGDVVESQLAHDTEEKKRRRRDEVVRRQLGKGDKNKIRGEGAVGGRGGHPRGALCLGRVIDDFGLARGSLARTP